MRRMRRGMSFALLLATLMGAPGLVAAQRAREGAAPGTPQRREQMEQQLRRSLWRITQQRIGLTDAQMRQLGQASGRFDERRRALVQEERVQRQTLRRELRADSAADQAAVAAALDRLHELQRQRLDLQVEEQRAFAAFMTPVQRAKYAALQEQVRRRVEMLRRQRPGERGVAELP